jgi:BASS family bile acid:Na+ symporter
VASDSQTNIITAFGMLFVIGNALSLGMNLKIGEILADFFRNWKFALRVLVINFVLLSGLIIGFAALIDIPSDAKIGYCIVALAAGAPFAPLLTRLAKGDVEMSTTLFVVLIVGTVIVVPLALSPTVTAVVPSVKGVSIWDVAWPLLLFLLTPIVLGCLVRLRYPDAAEHAAKFIQIIAIASLLMYFNIFIITYLSLFGDAWGSGTYGAAFAVPILGILFGSLVSLKNRGTRHASVITTAQRSVSGAIIVTVFNHPQPDANVSVTIINTIGITVLLILSLEWGRAQSAVERTPIEPK